MCVKDKHVKIYVCSSWVTQKPLLLLSMQKICMIVVIDDGDLYVDVAAGCCRWDGESPSPKVTGMWIHLQIEEMELA